MAAVAAAVAEDGGRDKWRGRGGAVGGGGQEPKT